MGSTFSDTCPYGRQERRRNEHKEGKVMGRWRQRLEGRGPEPRDVDSHLKRDLQGIDAALEPTGGTGWGGHEFLLF